MQISQKEYLILKKLYKGKQSLTDCPERESLLTKKLITAEIDGMNDGIIQISDICEISNSGIIAYEEYRFKHSTVKWTSIRSWIAIVISLLALVCAIIGLFAP